ncbi:MAG TPA: Crp/Fnr family transcriptional regulator [Bacteroidales bacterium]|nr:Crp/Fnr family transcriptional regulator [Bacteroidales bacterium]
MLDHLIEYLKKDEVKWDKFRSFFEKNEVPARTQILTAGDVSMHLHFVRKGCLRMWFNKDGKDITFQFFFEGQAVASLDSFLTQQPSLFTLESIEPTTYISISKKNMDALYKEFPQLKEGFQEILFQRFRNYAQLFLSRIKDSPQERYRDLLTNHPEIIKRVPQHYIASYLGITPISLSRIRNRK